MGPRRGDGTLTVGGGASRSAQGNFTDAGTDHLQRRLADHHHRHLLDSLAAGHTLRLNGTTTWSAGNSRSRTPGRRERRRSPRSPTLSASTTLRHGPPDRGVPQLAGALSSPPAVAVAPGSPVPGRRRARWRRNDHRRRVEHRRDRGPRLLARHADDQRRLHAGPGGTLRAEIDGIGAPDDRLDVDGTATLDGTLQLVSLPAFDPVSSDDFGSSRPDPHRHLRDRLRQQATPQKSYLVHYDATGVTLAIGLGPADIARPSIPASGQLGEAIMCQPGHLDRQRHVRLRLVARRGADRDRTDVHAEPRRRRPEHHLPRDGDERDGSGRADSTRPRRPCLRRRPTPTVTPTDAASRTGQGRAAATADDLQDGQRGDRTRHRDRQTRRPPDGSARRRDGDGCRF